MADDAVVVNRDGFVLQYSILRTLIKCIVFMCFDVNIPDGEPILKAYG